MNKLHVYPNNNLSKYDRKKLNDGDNLNVKLGPYGSASNNIVGSLLNKPTQVLNGEVTIDWYPSNDNSNYGTQILRHTRDNTINIYFRAKKGSVDNWSEWINLATKDDLTKSIDFRGNAKTFKVRSGTDGLKNIYLDIEDGSGNTCSLAFCSDGENAVRLMLNGKAVWTK